MSNRREDGIKFFFEPSSIAVAGVSPDSTKMASVIFSNLLRNRAEGELKATLYPLNPGHARVFGVRCYPSLKDLPEVPDLVIVAVPASRSLEVVSDAARAGAKAIILIPGGFSETGSGVLEEGILAAARRRGTRILGPNTIGVLDMMSGVDSLFLPRTKRTESGSEVESLLHPRAGNVAIITQSGHLGEVVIEELAAEGIGVRALIGTGNQLDVSVEDIIGYFSDDPQTKVIGVYLEGVRDGRRFLRIVSEAARKKPVVVYKVGKTRTGAKAALTHTASLVGDYEIYRAAFRAAGVVEAESLQELSDYCIAFSLLKRTSGDRLLISTNAGGVGAVAADEAHRNGLRVEPMRSETIAALRKRFKGTNFLPIATLGNPLDLTASVPGDEFAEATAMALSSEAYDMALILPTHQTPAIGTDIAGLIVKALSTPAKPVCVSVMGRAELARMIQADFVRRGVPSYPTPERAVRALSALQNHAGSTAVKPAPIVSHSNRIHWLGHERGLLTFQKTSRLLSEYGISQPRSVMVRDEADLARASALKFPVACKLASKGLLHKSALGGVYLNVANVASVRSAWSKLRALAKRERLTFEGMLVQTMVEGGPELLIGARRDAAFGPVVVFGSGGTAAESLGDYAVALAPVSTAGATDLIGLTKVGSSFERFGTQTRPPLAKLASVVSRFSRILAENRSIEQVEANPVIAVSRGAFAVDVRVLLLRTAGRAGS